MAKRFYREPSEETIKKISDSMKQYHANRSVGEKQATSAKQSASMKRYWQGVPSRDPFKSTNDGDTTN